MCLHFIYLSGLGTHINTKYTKWKLSCICWTNFSAQKFNNENKTKIAQNLLFDFKIWKKLVNTFITFQYVCCCCFGCCWWYCYFIVHTLYYNIVVSLFRCQHTVVTSICMIKNGNTSLCAYISRYNQHK